MLQDSRNSLILRLSLNVPQAAGVARNVVLNSPLNSSEPRRDGAALTRSSSANEVQDEEDDGDHDDKVNKTARDVKHEKPK
jgi:hypothetical protein